MKNKKSQVQKIKVITLSELNHAILITYLSMEAQKAKGPTKALLQYLLQKLNK